MKIEINIRWGMGSCRCGDVNGKFVVENGSILEDRAWGNERWQNGKATENRSYNAHIMNGDRITRFSKSKYFAALDKEMQRMLIAEAIECPRVKGDGTDPRQNHFWYLIAKKDCNYNSLPELNDYWKSDEHIKIS